MTLNELTQHTETYFQELLYEVGHKPEYKAKVESIQRRQASIFEHLREVEQDWEDYEDRMRDVWGEQNIF